MLKTFFQVYLGSNHELINGANLCDEGAKCNTVLVPNVMLGSQHWNNEWITKATYLCIKGGGGVGHKSYIVMYQGWGWSRLKVQ